MGKKSCTDRLHTSYIVKNPYSNCVLGTELFCTNPPPQRGRRVYEKANQPGPVGSGWVVRRRGGRGAGEGSSGTGGGAGGAGDVRARPGARTRRGPSLRGPLPPAVPPASWPVRRAGAPAGRPTAGGPAAPRDPGGGQAARGPRGEPGGRLASWRAGVGRAARPARGVVGKGAANDVGPGASGGQGPQQGPRRRGRGCASRDHPSPVGGGEMGRRLTSWRQMGQLAEDSPVGGVMGRGLTSWWEGDRPWRCTPDIYIYANICTCVYISTPVSQRWAHPPAARPPRRPTAPGPGVILARGTASSGPGGGSPVGGRKN